MNSEFRKYFLDITGSTKVRETEVIQSLWSGYGKISRYQLSDSSLGLSTVVVKSIALSMAGEHPRGWNTDKSHNRKIRSYEVETRWYETLSRQCSDNCKVPTHIGSFSKGINQWIVLEDLNDFYPFRKYEIELSEVQTCLKWLANFHATFLGQEPAGLWEIGTYWHLDTRPDELEKIENRELRLNAHLIDKRLNQCKYLTIVHGDAKLANFCFSEDGQNVAAVDFQYVGGGCGMKDVAYFLGSCLSSSECELYEAELLRYYFAELKIALDYFVNNIDFTELEDEWRRMYPLACVDFVRFLLGWMPSHQKINDYNLEMVNSVLSEL